MAEPARAPRASNPGSPLGRLIRERQSIWLDFIHRTMLRNGELKALIEARGVRGVTSNPTIFEQAIGKGDAYDEAIATLAAQGKDTEQIYEALAIEDIRAACDLFQPIYEMTAANDGYVSMEVSPRLAHDTEGSLRDARRLWTAIGRPNAMIKIPGTPKDCRPSPRRCPRASTSTSPCCSPWRCTSRSSTPTSPASRGERREARVLPT